MKRRDIDTFTERDINQFIAIKVGYGYVRGTVQLQFSGVNINMISCRIWPQPRNVFILIISFMN